MELTGKDRKNFRDLTNLKIGKLLVIRPTDKRVKGSLIWECLCDCGNICYKNSHDLYKAISCNTGIKSCGCLRNESMAKLALPKGVASMHNLYHQYRGGARRRNRSFDLSVDEFSIITQQNCFYCDDEPKQISNRGGKLNGSYIYNGIDRLDSTKGYSFDNCVACCWTCNKAKSKLSLEEFYNWVNKVYNNINKDKNCG